MSKTAVRGVKGIRVTSDTCFPEDIHPSPVHRTRSMARHTRGTE